MVKPIHLMLATLLVSGGCLSIRDLADLEDTRSRIAVGLGEEFGFAPELTLQKINGALRVQVVFASDQVGGLAVSELERRVLRIIAQDVDEPPAAVALVIQTETSEKLH